MPERKTVYEFKLRMLSEGQLILQVNVSEMPDSINLQKIQDLTKK